MRSINRFLVVFGACFLVLFTHLLMHELAHVQVAEMHGCVDVDWGVSWRAVQVWCVEYVDRSGEVVLQEAFLQSLVEVVGYHSVAFLFVALMFFVVRHKNWVG